MKIFDYIFFRVYSVYLKKNDPARFAGIAYMTTLYVFILFAFLGMILDFMKGIDKIYVKLIFITYFTLILFFNIKRYNTKNILNIKSKFQINRIPNRLFFMILPLSMTLGIIFYICLKKYIVDEYQLQGYLYSKWFR